MTNTELLKLKVEESGLKVIYICNQLGISPQGYYSKLRDGSDWTYTQVVILKRLLHLTDDEADLIFFTPKVEY